MPREKKNVVLKPTDYEIEGNSVRAFYDANGKLVFVLDLTTNDIKPNVLLVMASRGNRKWDDVLANDYGMNLENVRPKKDNKYQKLDVEYDGLVVYDNLIRAYENGDALDTYLNDLTDFRVVAARNSATERMDVARAIADNARETIDKTSDTIVELQAKIKAARAKIASLRRGIGREPTKESAAKILKAEAALDVLNDKLARAQKRLENANKRLLSAQDDMDAARAVLDLLPRGRNNKKTEAMRSGVVAPVVTMHGNSKNRHDDTESDDDVSDLDEETEIDADYDMDENNSEIKPLFDKDPNILDDKIAFKPIDFGTSDDISDVEIDDEKTSDDDVVTEDAEQDAENVVVDSGADDVDNAPDVAFKPPRAVMDAVKLPDKYDTDDVKLDDVFSESLDENVAYDALPADNLTTDVSDDTEQSDNTPDNTTPDDTHKAPVLDSLQNIEFVAPDADGLDDNRTNNTAETTDNISKAPDGADGVSEITDKTLVEQNVEEKPTLMAAPAVNLTPATRPGTPAGTVQNVVRNDIPKQTNATHKPGFLYYVLLLVLIALSVFTLWLYHRSNVSNDVMPTVVAENAPTITDVRTDETPDDDNPFVASGNVVTAPQPILTQTVESSLNKIADAADVPTTSDTDDDVTDSAPDVNPDVAMPQPAEPVLDAMPDVAPVVNKPEYNVSQENVFTNGNNGGGNLCAGDVAPDANGCCPGETYSTVNGQKVCCPDDGIDCYPPMF